MLIVSRVAAVIRDHHLVNREDKVVVAVSGGADSLALLHILYSAGMQLDLFAVYIDHNLRPLETPHEQALVQKYCHLLEVPFLTRKIDVNKLIADEKRSPEEAARILRYNALEEIRKELGAQAIAVGHTADDQVEEFFLRLLRGSSMKGLSGMQIRRGRIIRPLLRETKRNLSAYLNSIAVSWCEDSSNLQRRFLRNRVRLDLLPFLEQDFNPAVRRTVLQTMDVLAEEDHYLDGQAAAIYPQCVFANEQSENEEKTASLVIDTASFVDCHPAIRRRLLERCFWQMRIRPTYRMLGIVLEFLKEGSNGSEIHLEDGVRAEKSGARLTLSRPLAQGRVRGSRSAAPSIHLTIPSPGCYYVPLIGKELRLAEMAVSSCNIKDKGKLYLAREKISFPLVLRTSLPGELFHPCRGKGRKKISRFFNDRKIPVKDRPSQPVLVSGETIVALPGLQIDNSCLITEQTSMVLAISWEKREVCR